MHKLSDGQLLRGRNDGRNNQEELASERGKQELAAVQTRLVEQMFGNAPSG